MSKLSYEDKIDIYYKKNGQSRKSITNKYQIRDCIITYLVRLMNKHGFDILRKDKNKYYTSYQKEQIINRVLIGGESIFAVSIDEGLSNYGMLQNWLKKYKENGYNIVERKRWRSTMPKIIKKKDNETDKKK